MQASTQNRSDGSPSPDSLRWLEQQLCNEAGRFAWLSSECEIFSEMCADYGDCCAKLHELEQQGRAKEETARQYAEMRDFLTADIARCIQGVSPCRCREKQWQKQKQVADRLAQGKKPKQTNERELKDNPP